MAHSWCRVCILAGSLVLPALGVRLTVIDGRPIVDGVYVNGHGPYRFLVDTATTSNHMEPDLARSIGLSPTYRTELTSSLGVIVARGSTGVELALGDARADEQNILFAGMEVVHQLSSAIQGILGQQFLSRFDYMLDLRGGRLDFGRQTVGGKRAALRMLNGRAVVATSLGDLILDSGASSLILFGVKPDVVFEDAYMRTLAGSRTVGMVYSRLVINGRRVWSGHAVAIPDSAETGVAGLMPLRLFRTVYVCNSEGYAVFE